MMLIIRRLTFAALVAAFAVGSPAEASGGRGSSCADPSSVRVYIPHGDGNKSAPGIAISSLTRVSDLDFVVAVHVAKQVRICKIYGVAESPSDPLHKFTIRRAVLQSDGTYAVHFTPGELMWDRAFVVQFMRTPPSRR